ncbi:hypothetical protein SS209_03531 [Salmonella enterica subsp. enterica serovar Senftenberg str. SS209]|nr:hypothetical protein SS209_03531 [Salmonella enterica subsp. enterica serovar Senftenberg str. SS209]
MRQGDAAQLKGDGTAPYGG